MLPCGSKFFPVRVPSKVSGNELAEMILAIPFFSTPCISFHSTPCFKICPKFPICSCPIKPVRLLSSPVSQDVKFSFKAFDFRHNSSGFVYIHCEVTVCRIADPNCMMGCANRTKRAASVNPFGGSHLLSTGPFVMAGDNVKEGKENRKLQERSD